MFDRKFIIDAVGRSAENEVDRRRLFKTAGIAGLGAVGVAALGTGGVAEAAAPSDGAVLNFALNLEYLEAEFYSHAIHGHGLPHDLTTGKGDRGGVVGGHRVPFASRRWRQYVEEIACDERDHVRFLRTALGGAKVAQPKIDLRSSFTAAARAAGLIGPHQQFDPFRDEISFFLGAFIFEDVGVTAYKGAAPLIKNKTYLDAAAGILAVEAYHAATIRSTLYSRGIDTPTVKISNARDSLDGPGDDDQGVIGHRRRANIVPSDRNGIAYGRSAGQVLNIAYLTPDKATSGGFFPNGVNGPINASAGHS